MIAPSMIKLSHTITRFDMDGLYNLLLFVSESLTFCIYSRQWLNVASDTLPYPYAPICHISYIHSLVLLVSTNKSVFSQFGPPTPLNIGTPPGRSPNLLA